MGTPTLLPINLLNRVIFTVSLRFGAKAKEVERFIKFAIVGVVGAVVDFGVLNLLQATVLHPDQPNVTLKVGVAAGISFTCAVISNFIWNRYWTYPDSRTRALRNQVLQFFIVNAIGLAFRLWFVRAAFSPLGQAGVDVLKSMGAMSGTVAAPLMNRIGTNFATMIAVVIVMFWNFFVNRYWTYSDVE